MPSLELWLAWIGVNALGVLAPGPDILLILSRSLSGGARAGIAAAAGIAAGLIGHMVLVGSLLTASAAVSQTVFGVVRWVGVAYLCYVGVSMIVDAVRARGRIEVSATRARPSLGVSFRRGVITNVVNVKAAVWFFTVMPSFVRTEDGDVAPQIAVLGGTMIVLAFCMFSCVSLVAGRFRSLFERHPRAVRWQEGISGVLFVLLGLGFAWYSIGAASEAPGGGTP